MCLQEDLGVRCEYKNGNLLCQNISVQKCFGLSLCETHKIIRKSLNNVCLHMDDKGICSKLQFYACGKKRYCIMHKTDESIAIDKFRCDFADGNDRCISHYTTKNRETGKKYCLLHSV